MKKLMTVLMCLVLIIGTVGMVGCDATFKGNYKEVSADSAEVQQFAAETDKAPGSDNFDITKGAEMEFRLKGKAEKMKIDLSANAKIASVGEDPQLVLQAEGAVKGKVESTEANTDGKLDVDVKFYYIDGYGYLKGKAIINMFGMNSETELKNKIPLELENGLSELMGVAPTLPPSSDINNIAELAEGNIFAELAAMANEQEGIKIYLDIEARKVKIELSKMETEGVTCKGTVYLVYDEQYNMSAFKLDVKVTSADNEEVSLFFVFKSYSGTVKVPSEKEREEYKITAGLNLGF